MSDQKSFGSTISVSSLLGAAFVVLKLCHVIDWSWWWVTAPFWGPATLLLLAFGIAGMVLFIQEEMKGRK